MAGYSENREIALEIRQLRKALGEVDSGISLPDCLRGDALLHRLEGVRQDLPPMGKVLMPKKWARSWISYAAAFLLMVGLFYGLGVGRQGTVEYGEISLEPNDPVAGDVQMGIAPAMNEPTTGGQDTPAPPEGTPRTFAVPGAGGNGDGDGVGGSGQATVFEENFGGYALAYRTADETDPDRTAEITLELLQGDRMVTAGDVAGMNRVLNTFVAGKAVALVGDTADSVGVYWAVFAAEEIADQVSVSQPGTLKVAWVREGVLWVASASDAVPAGVEELETPRGTGACVLTALDLAEGTCRQAAVPAEVKSIKETQDGISLTYVGADAVEGTVTLVLEGLTAAVSAA